MGCLLTSGLCCCLSCCGQECASGLKRLFGVEKITKILYFLLIIMFTVPTIFIFFFLNHWGTFKDYFQQYISCPSASGSGSDKLGCIGISVVFRLSLALLILFTIMFIIMLFRCRISMVINQGCFCCKYLFVVGVVIAFLWVNNGVFMNYSQFCKYGSIVYMALQSIILIDLFYLAGIKLVKNYDQGQTQYACYLVFLSLIFEIIAVGLNVLGYIYFRSNWYGNTLWVNIITTIMLIILPIIQLLRYNVQNSLLTTALVSMFISYLSFIAQFSYSSTIDGVRMGVGSLVSDIVCSTFFFVLTMYGSIMGGTGQIKVTGNGVSVNEAAGIACTEPVIVGDEKVNKNTTVATGNSEQNLDSDVANQKKYTQSWQWVKWHFYMCIASIYLSMLITNWISVNITTGEIKESMFGFWVRVVISWLTFLLYIWTMIVPRICPSRDFRVE